MPGTELLLNVIRYYLFKLFVMLKVLHKQSLLLAHHNVDHFLVHYMLFHQLH